MSPLVSIIITTYRRPDLLERCINSVLGQEYTNVEILLVEDGPTEETRSIAGRYSGRIRYLGKPHGGIASTRNVGCKAAKGEYIAFVDDDDLFHPARITRLLKALKQSPEAICAFGQAMVVDGADQETGELYFSTDSLPEFCCVVEDMFARQIRSEVTVAPCNTLFLRRVAERIGFFDESYSHGCEDTDFFVRLSLEGDFVGIPDQVGLVRGGERNSLTRETSRTAQSKLYLLSKLRKYAIGIGRADLAATITRREYHWLKVVVSGAPLGASNALCSADWLRAFSRQPLGRKLQLGKVILNGGALQE